MRSTTIRDADESDITDLVAFHRSDFSRDELDYFGGSFHEMAKVFQEVEVESFERMIRKPSFRKDWWLVAEFDNRLAGEARGFPSWNRGIGDFIFLVCIVTHRDFRHCGIGSLLLNKMSAKASKAGYNAMVTTPEDIDGLVYNFYKKNGYEVWFRFDRMSCKAKNIESRSKYNVRSTNIENFAEVRRMNVVSLPSYVLEREIALALEAREEGEGDSFVAVKQEMTIGYLLIAPFFPEQSRLTILMHPEYTNVDNIKFMLSLGMQWIIKNGKHGAVIRTTEQYKSLFESLGFEERQKELFMIRYP